MIFKYNLYTIKILIREILKRETVSIEMWGINLNE